MKRKRARRTRRSFSERVTESLLRVGREEAKKPRATEDETKRAVAEALQEMISNKLARRFEKVQKMVMTGKEVERTIRELVDREAILQAGERSLVDVMWTRFVNRSDDYAVQHDDGTYHRVGGALTKDELQAHLDGTRTIGLYAINPQDQTVKWICWDLDFEDPSPEIVKPAVHAVIEKIKAHQLDPRAVLVEFSGRRGYHVWLFFDPPVSAALAYFIGRAIAREANVECEVFPKQSQLLSKYGNLVKLPLGKHRESGKESQLVTPDLAPAPKGLLGAVRPEFIMLTDEYRRIISQQLRPWMEVTAGNLDAEAYTGEDPPCVASLLIEGRSVGSRRPIMHRLGSYLLNFRAMRKDPEQTADVRQRLEAWNAKNMPQLTPSEFEAQWKSLTVSPEYNYGCHDEWFARQCRVLECPLMRQKISILFGDFTPEEIAAGEKLARSDVLTEFVAFTNPFVARDEELRRNMLRAYASAQTEHPINQAAFGRDSIGKTWVAVHTARPLDESGKHIWYLGGLSPTSLVHDFGQFDKTRGAKVVDLRGMTLLFLEPPHPDTWARLRPILSHDKDEISFKITDRTKSGKLRTTHCIIRGWPAVVQCAAVSGYKAGEYSSRFLTATPEISPTKTRLGSEKTARRYEKPWEYRYDTPEARAWAAFYDMLVRMRPIKVAIPYATTLQKHLVIRGPETMRVWALFLSLITANAALYCRQRKVEEHGYVVATVEDFEAVHRDFAPIATLTFLGLSSDTLEVHKQLAGRDNLTFEDIASSARVAFGADTSEGTIRDLYVKRLVDVGLLREKQDPLDRRRKLYDSVGEPPNIALFDDYDAALAEIHGATALADAPTSSPLNSALLT